MQKTPGEDLGVFCFWGVFGRGEASPVGYSQGIKNCSEGIAKSPLLAWIWRSRPSIIGSTYSSSAPKVITNVSSSNLAL